MTDTPPKGRPDTAPAGTESDERQRRQALLFMLEDLQASSAKIERARREWNDAFDAVGTPIFLHDCEFRIVRANRAYAKAAGMAIRDVVGKRYWEVFPKHEGPMSACARRMEKAEEEEEEEEEVALPTGEVFVSRGFAIRDDKGRYVHSIHILEDVTEKRRVQTMLETSERAYRTLAENLPGIVYRVFVREGSRMVFYNKMAREVTGYTMDELTPGEVCSIEPLILDEDRSQVVAEVKRAMAEDRRFTIEYRLRHKDGGIRWMIERGTPVLGSDGAPLYIDGVIFDVTERKRAEAAVAESEARFRAMVETTSDWIWETDAHGVYTFSSPKVKELLGYEPAEVVGRTPFDFMPPEEATRVAETFSTFATARRSFTAIENANRHKDGHRVVLETSGVPILNVDGTLRGFRGIDRDITERKRAEQALQRANRALKALSACNVVLIHAGNETSLLDDMCRVIVEEGGYRMVWIGLVEHDAAKSVRPAAHAGFEEGYLETLNITWADTERGRGPTGRAVRSGTPQASRDIQNDPQYVPWREQALKRGYASSNSLPLKDEDGEVFGVLNVYAAEPDTFDEEEVRLLMELADDLAFGILTLRTRSERNQLQEEHLRSSERIKVTLIDTIRAVALTVEKRDPYTAGHQQRVAELCVAIGRELGFDVDRLEGLRLGATIHDIGKVYIPAEILNRPGRLSKAEFEMIKSHPEVGYDIVKDVKFPWPVSEMILRHHERLDGTGYPGGLKGEAIILEARILAVADVVEAISAHRPYRPARGLEAALTEVEAGRGSRYDPAVADACLRLIREKRFEFSNG